MFYALLVLIALGVWLYCLFDVLATDEADVRNLPKFGWFLIVLLGFQLGAIMWLLFGRPRAADRVPPGDVPPTLWPGDVRRSGDTQPDRGPAPKGPEDDPEFLRHLERRIRGDD